MAWFKDHQRVLVYYPGSGGEYITSKLNKQKLNPLPFNRYLCINGFPGQAYLYSKAEKSDPVDWEWSEECRLSFNSEEELKDEIIATGEDWRFQGGNPDRELPRLGRRHISQSADWFPAHYDYGLFRDPVWKWLDCDNLEWVIHWAICIQLKTITVEKIDPDMIIKRYKNYRDYYSKWPEARISVDDEFIKNEAEYHTWAKKNIKTLLPILENKQFVSNSMFVPHSQSTKSYWIDKFTNLLS
jgi:hypothetical protein